MEGQSDRLLGKRWPWLAVAAVLVGLYLTTFVDLRIGRLDSRKSGSVADIEALSERTDLNVLFILIDTLRANHLGAWGYERDTSPILDHLAENGVRFARQLAQSSWTKCSMASLWTGMNPAKTGVTRFEHILAQEALMPAEILKAAGFRSLGLFRNGWVEGYHGFDQGFDTYLRPIGRGVSPEVRRENPTVKGASTDEDAVAAAIEFLRVQGDERWFIYLHHMDVHEYLYDQDTAVFGSSYLDVYDQSILREDKVINQLMVFLSEKGFLENTLIVIASDHGEAFGEHLGEGHARRVYREETHVPLILSFPFRLEPGVVVEHPTRNIDIWPTLFDLLGLPGLGEVDGESRLPDILAAARGEVSPPSSAVGFAHLDQAWGRRGAKPMPTVSVVADGFRYVMAKLPEGSREELFHSDADPLELEDVAAENPETLERLRGLMETYLAAQPDWEAGPDLEIDEVQLNQLRALGYKLP
ncbi:MAG: sulfatase [Myxococcota bacterium]|nr:sulfatase [Myxococcota bacterium]